jgi:hypothetical protein
MGHQLDEHIVGDLSVRRTPGVFRFGIPCGHPDVDLKDGLGCAGYRSAYGDYPRAGDRERTPLARGSNVGGRPVEPSCQTGVLG